MRAGEYQTAERLLQQAYTEASGSRKLKVREFAQIQRNLAECYLSEHRASDALPLARAALKLHESNKDKPTEIADAQLMVARAEMDLFDYPAAKPLAESAVIVFKQYKLTNKAELCVASVTLGQIYHRMGRFDDAEKAFQEALVLFGNENSLNAAAANSSLASLYWSMGKLEMAELYFKRALSFSERNTSPRAERDRILNMSSLGGVLRDEGKAWLSEQQMERVDEACTTLAKKPLACTIDPGGYRRRASYRMQLGDYASAEVFFKQILERMEQPDAPAELRSQYETTLMGLATLYRNEGRTDLALSTQKKLITAELKRTPNSWRLAGFYKDLADLQSHAGDSEASANYARAEELYLRDLSRTETEAPDISFPMLAETAARELALLYKRNGDLSRATTVLERGLKAISAEKNAYMGDPLLWRANFYAEAGRYEPALQYALRSEDAAAKLSSGSNIKSADALLVLCRIYTALGRESDAYSALSRAADVEKQNIALLLARGFDEEKRVVLANRLASFYLALTLQRSKPEEQRFADLSAAFLLERKGRGMAEIAAEKSASERQSSVGAKDKIEKLSAVRAEIAHLLLENPVNSGEAISRELIDLRSQERHLEQEIRDSLPTSASSKTSWRYLDVANKLPTDTSVVDFIVFRPFRTKTWDWGERTYAAYVVRAGTIGTWVDLGPSEKVDAIASEYLNALRANSRSQLAISAHALYSKIWAPLQEFIGSAGNVYICPDGNLSLVPFGSLLDDDDHYLIEGKELRYLSSARDLLMEPRSSNNAEIAVIADPDYGPLNQTSAHAVEDSNRGLRPYDLIPSFERLPGTKVEAQAIKSVLPSATLITGTDATETKVKHLAAPAILHIATHGFFLGPGQHFSLPMSAMAQDATQTGPFSRERGVVVDAMQQTNVESSVNIEDSLVRSGLALAGVNQLRSGDDDGVLTALEVAGMNLQGTKLVVLSACDTGVGKIQNGEGVFGLRRALAIAGAQHQMFSLWRVDDKATSELMSRFYSTWDLKSSPAAALRQVQLDFLHQSNYASPFYWASFVISGR